MQLSYYKSLTLLLIALTLSWVYTINNSQPTMALNPTAPSSPTTFHLPVRISVGFVVLGYSSRLSSLSSLLQLRPLRWSCKTVGHTQLNFPATFKPLYNELHLSCRTWTVSMWLYGNQSRKVVHRTNFSPHSYVPRHTGWIIRQLLCNSTSWVPTVRHGRHPSLWYR